jgi:hypothetical protein
VGRTTSEEIPMLMRSLDHVADHPPATHRRATVFAYAAAVWSLAYAGLALGWAAGVPGWPQSPFERAAGDPPPPLATGLPPLLLAALAMASVGVAIAIANGWGRSLTRKALLTAAWVTAASLVLAFSTERVLPLVAYAPIYLLGAPFDWPPGSYFDFITWPIVHEAICLLGGGLWALTAVWYRRRTGEATARATAQATRLDRWAVGVAVTMPLLYAITRYAWLLDIPLGIGEEFLREGRESGMWVAGASLATSAVVGALLTLGLLQRWGEVFPRWMPLLGGRRVPPALATVPASAVSVLFLMYGMSMIRYAIAEPPPWLLDMWGAALVPMVVLPVWGLALGVATWGYSRRRRASADPR